MICVKWDPNLARGPLVIPDKWKNMYVIFDDDDNCKPYNAPAEPLWKYSTLSGSPCSECKKVFYGQDHQILLTMHMIVHASTGRPNGTM